MALTAVGAALLVVALIAAGTRRPAIVRGQHDAAATSPVPTPTPSSSRPRYQGSTGQRMPGNAGLGVLAVLGLLAVVLLLALVIGALVVAAGRLAAVRRRRRDHRLAPRTRALVGTATAAAVAEALPDLLRAVRAGSPRAGIIAGWVRLEGLAADAGVQPHRSETPAELTIRVLDGMDVPGRWILRLADLYREARFSDHPMTEADRAEAGECLSALATPAPGPTAEGYAGERL